MTGAMAFVYRPELSAGNEVQIVDIQGKTEVWYFTAHINVRAASELGTEHIMHTW